jgi:NAD(P)-dependent dehydrogenase (short-subunit alcohol dehydrogenase family)
MSTVTIPSPIQRQPELLGQTVVVIGGSAGIGFETARRARAEGAKVILTGRLALEIAPVRVNLIAAGFVDTPLSAELLGDQLEQRRNQLRTTLPIGRVVGPADVATLAVHIMTNTALTDATYDIDGGQQFVRA